MEKQEEVIFREVQYPRHPLLWVFIIALAALFWYGFIQQIIFGVPFGNKPASDPFLTILWILLGIVIPLGLLLGLCKLETEVRKDGLYVRYIPFHIHYKVFLFKDIVHYSSITYNSLLRFGGWGIRFSLDGETAYNMGGNKGLELQLRGNRTVIVGSKIPEELIKALNTR